MTQRTGSPKPDPFTAIFGERRGRGRCPHTRAPRVPPDAVLTRLDELCAALDVGDQLVEGRVAALARGLGFEVHVRGLDDYLLYASEGEWLVALLTCESEG